ncbi:HAD family hydrolase [Paeniroseomonas aquatica]|uniref:HAD family hydrolase n=1 Tax=Paeniroseomonas aquatica TaxID=373043 RepID=UPI0036244D50
MPAAQSGAPPRRRRTPHSHPRSAAQGHHLRLLRHPGPLAGRHAPGGRRDPRPAPGGGGAAGAGRRDGGAAAGGGGEEQQRPPFRAYPAILQASLTQALAEAGHAATPDDLVLLRSILGRIAPHPEVPAALARLRTRYRIGIISNTDDELIAGTVAAIGTPVDFVVTAQQARAYKPDHRLFLHAHAGMGVAKEETIHVGMGQFTDLKVCRELGIRSVWIDRDSEALDPAWQPDAVLQDLAGLPALLLPG